MVKMVGDFKEGDLINKLINEKLELIKENKLLKQRMQEMIEQQYRDYYSYEENVSKATELTDGTYSDIEAYEDWLDSPDSDKLAQAYAEFNRNSTDYTGFNTYEEKVNEVDSFF